ncbi:hypothetical protein UPYG_G00183660 [Umbra pygmaea]|uniref:TMEM248/TMEM219 domain-containing protein n=1 Tax=Umbra pygmaea TaxID=75934 RepID=A0ABD0WR62_UMBPY
MGSWHPIANLREHVYQHPPGVISFFCVLILALTFLSLGSYTYTHHLPNPDTPQDWNHFLSSLAHLLLCVKANGIAMETVSSSTVGLQKLGVTAWTKSTQSPPTITNLSMLVLLAVMDTSDSQPLNDFHIHATLLASQLGLSGNEAVNVTLRFFSQSEGGNVHTCITVSAPTHILPSTLRPLMCPASERTSYPVTAVATESSNMKPNASQSCYTLDYTPDSKLTAMLTQKELGLARRHLMQVSVCLLAVCVVLLFTASFAHSHTRRYHNNDLDRQRKLLMDS